MNFTDITMNAVNKIMRAEKIVIYGAQQIASDVCIACETLVGKDKITIMVTHLEEDDERYLNGSMRIYELDEITLDEKMLLIVAMSKRYFHEIQRYPQLNKAGCVLYVDFTLQTELMRYALFYNFKKVGLDLRLFNRLCINDIVGKYTIAESHLPSIIEKAHELATEESARYVTQHMRKANVFSNRDEYHKWLQELIQDNQTHGGLNFEFGVASGETLWRFAEDGMNIFYGFDSFEGLPENWGCGGNEFKKGVFSQKKLPETPEHVELVPGWYDDSLPMFSTRAEMQGRKADFIHVDCDLYESTKSVFTYMKQFIKPGTIIAFDEYFNFPGWEQDEFKAFQEYITENHVEYEYLAYVDRNTQVCIRILKIGQ